MTNNTYEIQEYRIRDFLASMIEVERMNLRQRERAADKANVQLEDYWGIVDSLAVQKYQKLKNYQTD